MLKKHKLRQDEIPGVLKQIPSPPKELFILGELESLLKRPRLTIVGSRKITPYGRAVTEQLAREATKQGIVIVSGLAIGVDGIAHKAAIDVGGQTIAVLPCGLDNIYPRSHTGLARQILEQNGTIISEYPDKTQPYKNNFIARNRLVAGLGDALLVTEAGEKSGTLHTVNFALEQGKTVLAVPGNITSSQSAGTNRLIKSGAIPVTEINDILDALHLESKTDKDQPVAANEQEQLILTLIYDGISDGAELLAQSKLDTATFHQTLTMLEITGRIKPLGNNHWSKM